ncbi:Hypothetical predicted protein [Octopus vulgaris]|uniref:Uncharacterized protein n=1 Tax=Octopus vulgaris TaxID=6645 RepID=A0AA36F669_OCTVU|nr:Hypothetical predicted protein [Octopus vulgaris]
MCESKEIHWAGRHGRKEIFVLKKISKSKCPGEAIESGGYFFGRNCRMIAKRCFAYCWIRTPYGKSY